MLNLLRNITRSSNSKLVVSSVARYSINTPESEIMDLKLVVKRLQEYANINLACDWDNVGLLVEPSEKLLVKKVLITNDLTEPVLEESIRKNGKLKCALLFWLE